MITKKYIILDKSRLDELKEHGYEELDNCFYKELPRNYILRADKKTGELKLYHFNSGKTKRIEPHIQDLIKEGIVK